METAVSEKPVKSAKLTRLRNELAAAEARAEEARKVLAVTQADTPLMARIGAAAQAHVDAEAAETARYAEEKDLEARLLKAVGLVRVPEHMRSWRASAWDPEQSPAVHAICQHLGVTWEARKSLDGRPGKDPVRDVVDALADQTLKVSAEYVAARAASKSATSHRFGLEQTHRQIREPLTVVEATVRLTEKEVGRALQAVEYEKESLRCAEKYGALGMAETKEDKAQRRQQEKSESESRRERREKAEKLVEALARGEVPEFLRNLKT